jgi:hypothetical protein
MIYFRIGYIKIVKSVTLFQNEVIHAEILQLTVTQERDVVLNLQRRSRNEGPRKITEVNTRDKGNTAGRHVGAH